MLWKTTERDFETHSKRNQIPLKMQHGKEHVAATADTEGTSELPQHGVDLNGEFHFKVDGKGRMALPAKFRKVLSKDLVVTPELTNECVYVFETPDFNEWVEKLFIDRFGEYKESDREHVKLRRVLKSRARDVEVDARGASCCPRKCAPPSASTRKSWSWATRAASRSGTLTASRP